MSPEIPSGPTGEGRPRPRSTTALPTSVSEYTDPPVVVAIGRSASGRRTYSITVNAELGDVEAAVRVALEAEQAIAEADPKRAAASESAETDRRVLVAIDAGAGTADEVRIGTGLSRSATYKALGRLHAAGLVSERAPFRRLDDDEEAEALDEDGPS